MARNQTDGRISIFGRMLMIAEALNLISNGKQLTMPCVDATVTVSATSTSPRAITIQLKDANGDDIDYVESVEVGVFTDATRTAFSAGGSTGIAIGTDGALATMVAKKLFHATSESDGDIDLTHTDTGTDAAYVGVRLPSGRWVMGDRAATIGV